jgi:hypothetical protein
VQHGRPDLLIPAFGKREIVCLLGLEYGASAGLQWLS